MDKTRIRPIAICLFRNNGRILVAEGFDTVIQSYYYRPLGGGIDYGESGRDAIIREIREELDAEIENVTLIRVMENIFTYNGEVGHEIVFLYDAEFTDKTLYGREEIDAFEHEADAAFSARWMTPAEIEAKGARLVPEAIGELL